VAVIGRDWSGVSHFFLVNDMSEQTSDYNAASKRHVLYGFNVAVLVAISIAVLTFVLIVMDRQQVRAHTQVDVSSGKINSLSGSTLKLLGELNQKGKDYKLISLFPEPSDADKRAGVGTEQEERRRRINDMLQQYARNSNHLTVDDAGDKSRDDVEREIRDRYKGDLEPYRKAVADFDPIAKKFS
jgi:hypothetical protein